MIYSFADSAQLFAVSQKVVEFEQAMIETPWQIQLLGNLSAQSGTHVIHRFPTYKTGALFAYLAFSAPRESSREILADMLWPDTAEKAGRNSLSVALNALRRQLEPSGRPPGSVLQTTSATVRLSPLAICTDISQFDAACRNLSLQTGPDSQAVLEQAAQLYQGDLLPGYYEDWVGAERERLKDLYLEILRRLVKSYVDAADFNKALEVAHKAIQVDPLREASHRTLMRLYAASGRPVAALEHLRYLESLLKQSLDIGPARATRELAREIAARIGNEPQAPLPMRQSATLPSQPLQEQNPKPRQGEALPSPRLPASLTRYFGRAEEQNRIVALLTHPEIRLVTLIGIGGIGKTRLALEVTHRLHDAFQDNLCFVSLVDATDAAQVADAIYAALGLPRKEQEDTDAWKQVLAALSGAPWLLILDNFEHILETGSAVVHALLTSLPKLTCLVTSRERLNLSGEQEVVISPLPIPDPSASMDGILLNPGVQLFVHRAQSRWADFQVTPDNVQAIAELCAALEGLPLALELAASWSSVLTPAQMLARLTRRFELLQGRTRDLPSRHRSLRATLDNSYCFLSPELQHCFDLLSVFCGGWTLEAAAAVSNTSEEKTLDRLRRLHERSLITANETQGEMRYRMLETLKEYAAEHLTQEQSGLYRQRHAAYFAALAAETETHLTGPNAAAWLSRLESELNNLRAALAWSLEHDPAKALQTATDLGRFWNLHGHATEGRSFLETAQKATGTAHTDPTRLRALLLSGDLAHSQCDFLCARTMYEQALSGYQDQSDQIGEATALGSLGCVLMNQGHYTQARAHLERALSLNNALGRRHMQAHNLGALGYIAREMGDYPAARSFLEQGIAISESLGDVMTAAENRGSLVYVIVAQGDWELAHLMMQQTLATYRALGNRPGQAWALASLAHIVREQGRLSAARPLLEEALSINREIGNSGGEIWNREHLGILLMHLGEHHAAQELLEHALTRSREIGVRANEALIQHRLADTLAAQQQYAEAHRLHKEALTLMRELEMRALYGSVVESLAGIMAAEGDWPQAALLLGGAEALRQETDTPLSPLGRQSHDRLAHQIEAQLPASTFAEILAQGQALTPSQVVALALEEVPLKEDL